MIGSFLTLSGWWGVFQGGGAERDGGEGGKGGERGGKSGEESLYINYSKRVEVGEIRGFDVVILHPEVELSFNRLEEKPEAGQRVLGYVSVVEVAKDASYRDAVKELEASGVKRFGMNEAWKSDLMDVRDKRWREFVVETLGKEVVERGFDGFFLDTVDSVGLLVKEEPKAREDFVKGVLEVVKGLKKKFPEKEVVVNRGFELFEDGVGGANYVDGVLVESLFGTFRMGGNGTDGGGWVYEETDEDGREWLLGKIEAVRNAGKTVYVVDFKAPEDEVGAREVVKRVRELGLGLVPFVTTPELMGESLAPFRQVANRVMAIYGKPGGVDERGKGHWPVDSWVGMYAQTPLEWLGYEVDYHAGAELAPPKLGGKYHGILMDAGVKFSSVKQERVYAKWLVGEMKKGRKVVFMGEIPFGDAEVVKLLSEGFPFSFSRKSVPELERVTGVAVEDDAVVGFEHEMHFRDGDYPVVKAGKGDKVALGVNVGARVGGKGRGKERRVDVVFTGEWGGMALSPFLLFSRPDGSALWQIDPFLFLDRALGGRRGEQLWMDTTTRWGTRMFFSHIDGDAFSNKSEVIRGACAGEVIRDEILKKYPLPITVSVIESEMRGWMQIQKDGESEELMEIARSIFELPNVDVATHTYTHPFYWLDHDLDRRVYPVQKLVLKPEYQTVGVDYVREVQGSMEFINEHLLPEGKEARLVLWSGNCRPGVEALRVVRENGYEAMNGGDTVVMKRNPSVTAVAPRTIGWGGEMQVHCAIQNEMLYTNDFLGPLYGGFRKAIQSFEMTETPRRLKAAGIYYHFFSADRAESLEAVKVLYDWAMEQELHAVTGTYYAGMVRDARNARIYEVGKEHWRIGYEGWAQTVRMVDRGMVPDFERCRGVVGFYQDGGMLYVSLDGSGVADLVMKGGGEGNHFYVERASGDVVMEYFSADELRFRVNDFREVRVVVGGGRKGEEVRVNGEVKVFNEAGKLEVNGGRDGVMMVKRMGERMGERQEGEE